MTTYGEPRKIEQAMKDGAFCALQRGSGGRKVRPVSGGSRRGMRRDGSGSSDLKAKPSEKSPPVRKDRVEEARKRRQNGDYDTREVYRRIAERLIDSFGI